MSWKLFHGNFNPVDEKIQFLLGGIYLLPTKSICLKNQASLLSVRLTSLTWGGRHLFETEASSFICFRKLKTSNYCTKQYAGSKACRSMLSDRIIGSGDDYGNLMCKQFNDKSNLVILKDKQICHRPFVYVFLDFPLTWNLRFSVNSRDAKQALGISLHACAELFRILTEASVL